MVKSSKAKWRVKREKVNHPVMACWGFFIFFFSWPSLYPILSCSHRHHFQPNYPLSLAPLAAYGNVNCSILFPLFFPSCGRYEALEEEKSRRKKRKSWQTSENKGAPLVPVTCQHYSIRYPSPPTKETLSDRWIYAATHICKTKKVRKPLHQLWHYIYKCSEILDTFSTVKLNWKRI